jgi:hypothetical protein
MTEAELTSHIRHERRPVLVEDEPGHHIRFCVACGRVVLGWAVKLRISTSDLGVGLRHVYYHPECAKVLGAQLTLVEIRHRADVVAKALALAGEVRA